MEQSYKIERSRWLSKATLVPKSHQEDVHDISKFKWRFCVIYVGLNRVTRVWAFPVPHCNDASMYEFGDGRIDWFFDCLMCYHQIEVNERSRPKLAFAGPDTDLYMFGVIPFGAVNGPEIFDLTAHDMNQDWQERVITKDVTIDRDTNTRLIVDSIFNHSKDIDLALIYVEAQLDVSALWHHSLSLPKSSFFVERVEFVGVDISPSGNTYACTQQTQSSPQMAQTQGYLRRCVASFIACSMFYVIWIPWFEM